MKKLMVVLVLILVVAGLAVATQETEKNEKYIVYATGSMRTLTVWTYKQAIDYIRQEAEDSKREAGPVYREWQIWKTVKVADITITFPDDPVLEIKKIP